MTQLDDGLVSILRLIFLMGGDTDIPQKTIEEYGFRYIGTKDLDSLALKEFTHYSVTYRKHKVDDVYNLMAIARHQNEYNV